MISALTTLGPEGDRGRLPDIIASMAPKAQLIVRNLDPAIVAALRTRAARSGRSMEAEHREILRSALRPSRKRTSFKEWLLRMPHVGTDRDFTRARSRARRAGSELSTRHQRTVRASQGAPDKRQGPHLVRRHDGRR